MFSEKPIETTPNQSFLQKLKELDLKPIAHQLMQSGWTHQQTRRAINRYKIFLLLIFLYPHTPLVPTQEIDQVWHCHILYTRKYREDCQMLFGYFIDHEPNLKIGNGEQGTGNREQRRGIGEWGIGEESFSSFVVSASSWGLNTKLRSDIVVETDGEAGRREDGEKMNVLRMNTTWYNLKLGDIAEHRYLDIAFAQTQALLMQYFDQAALENTKLEQPNPIELVENLPQQQKLSEKDYWYLYRSACGRPESSLREEIQLSASQY